MAAEHANGEPTVSEPSEPTDATGGDETQVGRALPGRGRVLASRGVRLGAFLLDQLIVGFSAALLVFVLGMDEELMRVVTGEEPPPGSLLVRIFIVQIGVHLALNGYLLGSRGQTIGKMLVGIRIVDANSGALVPLPKLYGVRELLPKAIFALPTVGPLMMLADALFIFGDARRCVHDYLCGTVVEEASRPAP